MNPRIRKMIFDEEWESKELLNLEKGNFSCQQKIVLQLLISYLHYIDKEGIRTKENYNTIKEKITKDYSLVDIDDVKANIWRKRK